MDLHGGGSYTWGIFAILTSMTSILKLAKNPKTSDRVVRRVLILIGNVIYHDYT